MKVVSRSIKFFFIVVALLLFAVIVFVATFDANNYKPQIIEQVEKATGRDFSIDGDIVLSVFPWVGLQVEDATLGNAAGFKAEQFAAIKQLDIKVNVLPLLKKEVQINTIRLHGLNVSLEVAKDKSNNWSSLAQSDQPQVESTDESSKEDETKIETAAEEGKVSPLQSLMVEGFEFVDAQIHYDDRSSNTKATVSELNLSSSAIEFDQPVDIQFSARIENNQPLIDTRLKLTTQLTFNKDFTEFDLADFIFTVLLDAKANAELGIQQDEQLEIKSSIKVLMDEQRVTLKQLQISALGTITQADITVSQFLQTPLIQGGIEVQAFNARQVAARVGVELPVMAKADALHQVSLKTKIKLQGEKLEANDFSLMLDGSTLSGWLHIINLTKQQLRYDLVFDHLNINNYLPPVVEEASTSETVVAAKAAETNTSIENETTGDEKIELPVEMMRQLDIQGDFRIKTLIAKEYDIKQFLMSLKAQDGEIVIKPLSMHVLEGEIGSAMKVNVQKAKPAYVINLDVNQVQVGPVVNPILEGLMGEKPVKMDGAVNLTMDVKTAGDTVNLLKKASKGQIVLDMKETRVDGFDPEYYMRLTIADYVHSKGFGQSKTIMGSYKPREVTVFDRIFGTVTLANGKASTSDFIMDSKRVKVGAEGYADIMQNTLDVTSSVKLPRGKTAAEKVLDSPLYVRVHGPFDALQYDLDKKRLKKSTTDVLKKEVKAKLKAEEQKLKAKAEEKAKKELKKTEDKLKDKLKDKFKGLF